MRADITAVLLHNPDIIYPNEPTMGLDIAEKDKIRDFIRILDKKEVLQLSLLHMI
jgi:ABC-2 type transport system ATP-binding protein